MTKSRSNDILDLAKKRSMNHLTSNDMHGNLTKVDNKEEGRWTRKGRSTDRHSAEVDRPLESRRFEKVDRPFDIIVIDATQ